MLSSEEAAGRRQATETKDVQVQVCTCAKKVGMRKLYKFSQPTGSMVSRLYNVSQPVREIERTPAMIERTPAMSPSQLRLLLSSTLTYYLSTP